MRLYFSMLNTKDTTQQRLLALRFASGLAARVSLGSRSLEESRGLVSIRQENTGHSTIAPRYDTFAIEHIC